MAKKKVADLTVDTLAGAAVERIYGVSATRSTETRIRFADTAITPPRGEDDHPVDATQRRLAHRFHFMLAQTVALLAAIVHALRFILCKRGLRFSTPITITFVSLLVQTVVLFGVVLTFTGLPSTSTLLFSICVVCGILQALVRQLTNIGIEKIGTARSGPIRASVPLWSTAIAIFFWAKK